ncbi:MAG: ABC transporter permease [Candidatus Kapabacteria bacterium]|nr:ABC transporter permease [Candidatus Kapabacteria bacterium]MBX7154629.1 ABC transporter permease [Bacteroidota bacterium]
MIASEYIESFSIAFAALRQNKLRAVLTTLGIVIGIAVVTLMGWALNSLDAAFDATIDILGNDMLYVDKWSWAGGNNWRLMESRKNITIEQAEELIERLKTPQVAVPMGSLWGRSIIYNDLKANGFTVTGVRATYTQTPAGNVDEGRFFSEIEDRYSENVVVVGYGVKKVFFPNSDPIGKTIKINGMQFTIIGVIAKRGTALMDFVDNQVFIPLNSFFGLYGKSIRSISIAVKAGSPELLDDVRSEVVGTMRIVRNLPPGKDEDFSINESQMFHEQVAEIRFYIWAIGIFLTAMSFIVGMIGIMNVMFVSVTERTKEIGIRKAIGAKRLSILMQFLVEAATLCVAGAIVAILLCIVAAAGIYFAFKEQAPFLTPYIPVPILIIAIVVSVVVGILAGLFPALRAARMNPVDALRYE